MTNKIKKNTKSVKPAYFVYVKDIETIEDIDAAFGIAKQEAGLPISTKEFDAIVDLIVKECAEAFLPQQVFVACDVKVKKQPWYKRLWNWIRRK